MILSYYDCTRFFLEEHRFLSGCQRYPSELRHFEKSLNAPFRCSRDLGGTSLKRKVKETQSFKSREYYMIQFIHQLVIERKNSNVALVV